MEVSPIVSSVHSTAIPIVQDEHWWGGAVQDGSCMPFAVYRRDLAKDHGGNQAVPLLVSSKGRYVWSDDPFRFSFEGDSLRVDGADIRVQDGFGDLRGAFLEASRQHFPPQNSMPASVAFSAPQFNTWMEMGYEPTQERVLAYVKSILANGIAPGVLILDDGWSEDYGQWTFHPARFPDPALMMSELRELGFAVVLWLVPFVSPDSAVARDLARRGWLVRDARGEIAIRQWWNGHSALIDATHPRAVDWLCSSLDQLIEKYGIAGFKMDGGDIDAYRQDDLSYVPSTPAGHCEAWGRIGQRFTISEYRACWKLGGSGAIQRLRDKHHRWGRDGLADLIPNALAQGLAGHAFVCPDMVGGGDIGTSFGTEIDAELFVRTAQCSALFPMIQFSIAPWRVLDPEHLKACHEALRVREMLLGEILHLANHASKTGEPILRHMSYVFPDNNYEAISDQFLLGENVLVAPVLDQGASKRKVVFPNGKWVTSNGQCYTGPTIAEVDAPLDCLPWFRRLS